MQRFEHGGNVYRHRNVLDFSANLNPLGMPDSARNALRDATTAFEAYPDPDCRELTQAIADFEELPSDYVLACAGATDAFTRICLSQARRAVTGKVLVCAPCYSGYEQAIEQVGMTVEYHLLAEADGLNVTETLPWHIGQGFDMVFLANPNNPTGLLLDDGVLNDALEAARDSGAIVVLDECFIDLTGQKGSTSLLDVFPNLVVVKALTKTYALAGLRVGYALCSDLDLVDEMRAAGQPWNVSTPAQVAGVAALRERGYIERACELIAQERARLAAGLEAAGCLVVPGKANYLLFKVPDAFSGSGVVAAFLEHGILIRHCENYQGLGEPWCRIAVRTPQENDRLLAALKEVLA